MTTTNDAQYLQVPSTANERLSQLHAAYASAKAESDEASARLKLITDGIKSELQTLAPGEEKLTLSGDDGPTMTLVCTSTARFDSTRFKREHPEEYVRYAKFSDSWTLKAIKGGASE